MRYLYAFIRLTKIKKTTNSRHAYVYQKICTSAFTITTCEYSKTGKNTNDITIKYGKVLKIKYYPAMKKEPITTQQCG